MPQILRRKKDTPPILEQVSVPDDGLRVDPLAQQDLDTIMEGDLESIHEEVGEGISKDALKLPTPPGPYLNWEQWESYARGLTKDHWSHLDCYLYRYEPIIDREPKYIDCFAEWKDFNYYISTHGGGRYGLVVSDRALPKRSQKICSVNITVDKEKFDPILNLADLDLGDKKNRAYINKLINQGKLTPEMEIVPMQPRSADQSELVKDLTDKLVNMATDKASQNGKARESGIENQAASRAIDMVSDVSKKLMDQQINNNDPMKMLEMVSKLVGPKDGGSDKSFEMMKFMTERSDKITQMMMESIKSTNERMEKLIEKIGEHKEGGGGANLDSLNTMLEIAERLGGGKSSSTLDTVLSTVKDIIPHFAGPLMQGLMARQAIPIQPTPIGALPSPNPQVPEGVITMPTPSPESQPTDVAISVDEVAKFISQSGARILQALERNETGAELAEFLEGLMGYDAYLKIKAVIADRTLLMEAAKRVPQFYMSIKGHGFEKFEAFLVSFEEWSTLRDTPATEGEGDSL